MSRFFKVATTSESDRVLTLTIAFGDPADNTQIVPDAIAAVAALKLTGGRGIHFDGPATLPAAMALTHAVAHLYGYVACFDPKLRGYVVAISHDPSFRPGQLLAAAGSR